MSNCVDIHTEIVIDSNSFDCDRLLADIKEYNDVVYAPEMTPEESMFYWFLGNRNVYMDGDEMILRLGEHRSTHTWRDLRWTQNFLRKYLLVDRISCDIVMTDEYDGFAEMFTSDFTVERPNPQPQ